jgi:hypothetical protein
MRHPSYLLILLFAISLLGGLTGSAQLPQTKEAEESIRVYPNPVDQKGTIELELDQDSRTIVEIYNLAGKRVKLVAEQHLNAGKNRVEFEAGDLKEGIYFCKVSTNQWIKTKRMLIKR